MGKGSVKPMPHDCCGQCAYFHQVPNARNEYGCYAPSPVYSHMDEDVPIFVRNYSPCKSTDYVCRDFKPSHSS